MTLSLFLSIIFNRQKTETNSSVDDTRTLRSATGTTPQATANTLLCKLHMPGTPDNCKPSAAPAT